MVGFIVQDCAFGMDVTLPWKGWCEKNGCVSAGLDTVCDCVFGEDVAVVDDGRGGGGGADESAEGEEAE